MHLICILGLETMAVYILRNSYDNVACVETQVMGARYDARPVSMLVTQMAGVTLCQKLSSLSRFHFENL
jgi:hypothetical protein